jgi:hypothetical protein
MKTIYKYPLPHSNDSLGPAARCSPRLPIGSRVVAFQLQEHVPTMWIEHDLGAPTLVYDFGLFVTGQDIPEDAAYQGTVQIADWGTVHLYLLGKREA